MVTYLDVLCLGMIYWVLHNADCAFIINVDFGIYEIETIVQQLILNPQYLSTAICSSYIFASLWKKGLKRQKEAKTIKNRQETGKRQRVKSKSEGSARDHSRISPTQSKKEIKEVKSQITSQRAKNAKYSKNQGLIGSFKDSRTKVAKEEKCFIKERQRAKQPQGLKL
ncbi:hypothetical protein Tco_0739996 [Tanacetum coccineum]